MQCQWIVSRVVDDHIESRSQEHDSTGREEKGRSQKEEEPIEAEAGNGWKLQEYQGLRNVHSQPTERESSTGQNEDVPCGE